MPNSGNRDIVQFVKKLLQGVDKMKYFFKKFNAFLLTLLIIVTIIPQSIMAADKDVELPDIEISEVTDMDLSASTVVTVYNFLVTELRLTPAAACGIMANIEHESSFNPTAKTGRSYGLCQWTGSRFTLLKKWCKKNGYNYKTAKGQLNYLKSELTNSKLLYDGKKIYNYLLSIENTAQGAYEAASYWCRKYERPARAKTRSHKRGNLSRNSYWPVYGNSTASITSIKAISDGITLNWKGKSKAYDIYRSTDCLNFKKVGTSTTNSYVDASKLTDGEKYYYRIYGDGYYSTTTSFAYSTGTSISKAASSSKGSLTVKWNKADDVTGYQIQYSTDSSFSKDCILTIKDKNINTTTIKSLSSGKTYYVRVRTYTSHNGDNFYSSYSNTVEVIIK